MFRGDAGNCDLNGGIMRQIFVLINLLIPFQSDATEWRVVPELDEVFKSASV